MQYYCNSLGGFVWMNRNTEDDRQKKKLSELNGISIDSDINVCSIREKQTYTYTIYVIYYNMCNILYTLYRHVVYYYYMYVRLQNTTEIRIHNTGGFIRFVMQMAVDNIW